VRVRARLRTALLFVLAIELALATAIITRPPEAPPTLAWSALRNATYPTSLALRTVTLRDGAFEAEAAPGSAARIIVRLVDLAAFGDLNGDASPDAAVVLVTSAGGTGVFVASPPLRPGLRRPHRQRRWADPSVHARSAAPIEPAQS